MIPQKIEDGRYAFSVKQIQMWVSVILGLLALLGVVYGVAAKDVGQQQDITMLDYRMNNIEAQCDSFVTRGELQTQYEYIKEQIELLRDDIKRIK